MDDQDERKAEDEAHEFEAFREQLRSGLLFEIPRGRKLTTAARRELAYKAVRVRQALDLTQVRLAEISGVPLRTISHIEAGGIPQTRTLVALAEALADEIRRQRPETSPPPPAPAAPPGAAQLLTDVAGPMFEALPPGQQAVAIRKIVLLLQELASESAKNQPG